MNKRIGIVGGGQLGRMITVDAKRLGFAVTVIDPTPDCPAKQVGADQIVASYNDEKAIKEIAKTCDFLTFEIELANASILDELSGKGLKINPSPKTLSIIKDKLEQKKFLKKAGIPVADFIKIKSSVIPSEERVEESHSPQQRNKNKTTSSDEQIKQEIIHAARKFGYPLLLKARFDAYDGRGNALIKNKNHINEALDKLRGRKLYVEKFVPFIKELAVIAARSANGDIVSYQVVETVHKNNICHTVTAPAPINEKIYKLAEKFARTAMQHLNGAGVFGIEMFLTKDNALYINEIAPRVHNSGHYTIEACVTSQFEQHVRAITGLPLGSTEMKTPSAVMINILGEKNAEAEIRGLEKALAIKGMSIHIYGKKETKVERKMGHITAIGKTTQESYNKAIKARKLITI